VRLRIQTAAADALAITRAPPPPLNAVNARARERVARAIVLAGRNQLLRVPVPLVLRTCTCCHQGRASRASEKLRYSETTTQHMASARVSVARSRTFASWPRARRIVFALCHWPYPYTRYCAPHARACRAADLGLLVVDANCDLARDFRSRARRLTISPAITFTFSFTCTFQLLPLQLSLPTFVELNFRRPRVSASASVQAAHVQCHACTVYSVAGVKRRLFSHSSPSWRFLCAAIAAIGGRESLRTSPVIYFAFAAFACTAAARLLLISSHRLRAQ
jgi:hypothetical protein